MNNTNLIILNTKERLYFRSWLLQEAGTEKSLLDQIEKLGPSMENVAKMMQSKITAYLLVAQKLQTTEEVLINSIDKK